MTSSYQETYQKWQNDPEGFWGECAKDISWYKPWEKVFDESQGIYGRWFSGGTTNLCHNCVDRHVNEGRGEQLALIYDSPITGKQQKYTYNQMLDEVGHLAWVLQDLGVEKGDRVIIYMPMIAQAAFAMLACARIGAIHSVVFGGFAASELATRIDDCRPKLIMAASCGIEPSRVVAYKPMLDEAISLSNHKPSASLIFQREEAPAPLNKDFDVDWSQMLLEAKSAGKMADCVAVEATEPCYILYTSGTTGQPKGVVRDTGGHMVALKWTMGAIYDIRPGEVYWAASDVGWVVGHSYIVYAPLLNGNTTIIFEGKPVGTPDAGVFWRVISEHKVAALFTAPTAFRAIKKEDPEGKLIKNYDLSDLRTLFLAGERADPDTIEWAEKNLKRPVIDHWWQTETGWAIAANPLGLGMLPIKHGSPTVAMPGYDVQILDDEGNNLEPNQLGNIAVKLPLPPSCLPTLWNADSRFKEAYLQEFPGFYSTSDAGYMDEDGYLYIMSRTDDIINVAGHRLSTGAMEEVIASHKDVAECAVVGIADKLKGQMPAGFLIINAGVERPTDEIEQEVIKLIRTKIGPVAAFKLAFCIKRLPKTRSGKILRGTIQKMADGIAFKPPATIDDPAILDEIYEVLDKRGILNRQ